MNLPVAHWRALKRPQRPRSEREHLRLQQRRSPRGVQPREPPASPFFDAAFFTQAFLADAFFEAWKGLFVDGFLVGTSFTVATFLTAIRLKSQPVIVA
ncbi:hypothetical protein [Burkholderia ubonensis]|uniref:hypothetical protein n=1 Tax=Burkholderia ubonensis TaxID=101571 RepID=UPI0012FC97A6|nr:hypothetical protein [Burkholderia ubonensis]